ncbi:protein phosphatase 1J [Dermochelys coriacea]|uniref:protein phosphatase 1J n=1 Tax=Dermochelys coriacea TaxID=27794 RepID=UPI001CA873ED|nr:protein phosphatase 1J [Dermochelys coriacea]
MLGRVRTAVARLVGGLGPAPGAQPPGDSPAPPRVPPGPAASPDRPFCSSPRRSCGGRPITRARAVQSPREPRRRLPWSTGYAEGLALCKSAALRLVPIGSTRGEQSRARSRV